MHAASRTRSMEQISQSEHSSVMLALVLQQDHLPGKQEWQARLCLTWKLVGHALARLIDARSLPRQIALQPECWLFAHPAVAAFGVTASGLEIFHGSASHD